ncbi:MAG: VCBS repeat-containing protein [Sedimentisphaerales bacterium]|nr:VCBS repeat-containing protein [Sedimentisphaerales bacterium]
MARLADCSRRRRTGSSSFVRLAVLVAATFVLLGCASEPANQAPPLQVNVSEPVRQALVRFNQGAALLEQYKYVEAAEAFEQVLQTASGWTAARFNLGLAYLNTQEEAGAQENLNKSREAFESVLRETPDHRYARFCLGLYYQHIGEHGAALECFRAVHEADPNDPHAAYKYAETLINQEQREPAARLLERIVEQDPGFVSAVYRLAMVYQRVGRRDEARDLFARFRELQNAELTGGTFAVLNAYGSVGRYCLALGADGLPIQPSQAPSSRVVFSPQFKRFSEPVSAWRAGQVSVKLPGVAAGDVDADGDIDLCICALGANGDTALYLNDGSGAFERGQVLAEQGICPALGDVDNDGDLDLWLGRIGADMYFTNDGTGHFTQAELGGVAPPDVGTHSARLVDIDSDGDLDLMAFHLTEGSIPRNEPGQGVANNVFNNNRDGSFADIAEKLGLTLATFAVAASVCDDFDNDRDLDMVIFAQGGSPIGWVNDRVWRYHALTAESMGIAGIENVLGATTGDPDGDGDRDLLVFTESAVHLFLNTGGFRFERDSEFTQRCGRTGASGGQFVDIDNDGDLDIMVADRLRPDGRRGPALLVNEWPRRRFTGAAEMDPGLLLEVLTFDGYASCIAADFTGNGICDVFLAPANEAPFLVENATKGGHWIQVDLQGIQGEDGKSRSNNSAIGARVDVKAGLISQQHVVGVPSGPVASPPLRVHAGLGAQTQVDWLRITWPDAVLQAELELPADQTVKIAEVQRKVSSCPHLFAWNGSHIEFVSDFGGMGGLGYLVAPGTYAPPDSTEYVPVPNLAPRNGEYLLQVVEPLEEIVYMDEVKLLAVDHPAGTTVYPNEMMAVNAPAPEFELFCVGETIEPVRAVDHRGAEVTQAIKAVDRVYAGPTQPDPRFVGYAEEHFVELDFGERLSSISSDARLILFLYGWVHYGYSATNFAAGQAGIALQAPSIYAEREGRWVELFHEVGYPAGIRHMMTLDVTGKLLPTDRRIRIATNMELYWDQIFVASVLTDAARSVHSIDLDSADLHFFGYPREYSPDGRHPNLYDYSQVDRALPWKTMRGAYTRYGDVTTLLQAPDDRYVIMGPGEEITLHFPADTAGQPASGSRRSFILKTDSYCKDMDLYTAYPETVEPLPFHGMSTYPYEIDERYPEGEEHQKYHVEFNTRHIR